MAVVYQIISIFTNSTSIQGGAFEEQSYEMIYLSK